MSFSKFKSSVLKNIKLKKNLLKNLNIINNIKNKAFHSLNNKRKVFICGNGRSAADTQNLAAEFIVRLRPKANESSYRVFDLLFVSKHNR